MSAFYHGTDADLAVGERLAPGNRIGKENWPGMDVSWGVWMTPRPELAAAYGRNVYEVRPQGPVTDWAEENGWDRTPENDEFVADAAVVVRRVTL